MDNLKLKVSKYFTFKELIHSDTAVSLGLVNNPDLPRLVTCIRTAAEMDKIREFLGSAVFPSSWYRSPTVNTAVGSVNPSSQHTEGEAVDFVCPGFGTPAEIVRAISQSDLIFDQLILEHSWVHISFAIRSGNNRKQVLSLLHNKSYAVGITDKYGTPIIF